jgi:hypothetical protein
MQSQADKESGHPTQLWDPMAPKPSGATATGSTMTAPATTTDNRSAVTPSGPSGGESPAPAPNP